jgi:hypothetical protein
MKDIIINLINKVIIPKYGEIEYEVVLDSPRPKYILVIYRFPNGQPEKKIMSELFSDTKMLLDMLGIENMGLLNNFWKMIVIKGVLN